VRFVHHGGLEFIRDRHFFPALVQAAFPLLAGSEESVGNGIWAEYLSSAFVWILALGESPFSSG
jgi:hypothetical protein